MTNEEMIEAEKLIADMKDDIAHDLALIARTDADELLPLLDKGPRMFESYVQLCRLGAREVFDGEDLGSVRRGLIALWDTAVMAGFTAHLPEHKARLIEVAGCVSRVDSALDKIAQGLSGEEGAG